ncbi:multiple organellar RNA editing factor 8, chloroplastic/mitochondrial [Punica granatum]|uniref:MORF/ORRM1/DAG-like MORF domain-containing protein n=2 Tax=Punica granatum TaxID=22663 RepID=A0A218XUT4_PUNGR|nr:multiple organellar RNA editing factor 8, chloroplastic/mitochondrial [Punica granatum]OWM88610.1 hypothetical protein CDL15_Pgr002377 [Punica granatum]PKI37695.1 hypothetical protein CRG98_041988 [Punica granatum]
MATRSLLSRLVSRSLSSLSFPAVAPPRSQPTLSLVLLHRLRPLSAASAEFRLCCTASFAARSFSTRATSSSLNDPSPNWSNRPPKETILLDGCDFEHWLVVMEKPSGEPTRDEIIDSYIKTLAKVIGSEEEARMKIYSVSTRHYFAFGALVSEEDSYKLKELEGVRWVLPDSYLDVKNKDYGGEPFINGQAVPYDPKYHEEWVRNNARANERNRRNDRPRNFDRSRNFERRRENMQNNSNPQYGAPPNQGGAPFPPNNASSGMPPNPGTQGGPPNLNYQGGPPNQGYQGGAPNQGYQGGPPNQGYQGGPPNQGYQGGPPNQGYQGGPPNQGYQGGPPNQGYRSGPPNQGYSGGPPNQGYSGGPPNQGYSGGPPNQGYQAGPPNQGYQAGPPNPNYQGGNMPSRNMGGPSPPNQGWNSNPQPNFQEQGFTPSRDPGTVPASN